MRAARFTAFGGPIDVVDLPDPSPPPGGIVVEVKANGICRSDWHGWVGHDPSITLPHVPGHEMAGVVAAVGDGVSSIGVGERVTFPFVLGCGACSMCRAGDEHVCANQYQAGFSGWGACAQFVALPYAERNVVRIPDGMAFTTAAGLGCRFATAFRAVVDQGGVASGDPVAIWGCGGLGLSAVMIASAIGAEVFAVDIDARALELAERFGARHTFDSASGTDVVREIREMTDGGVAVSFDTLGATVTSLSSIRSLRSRGRHVQVGLMLGDDAKPPIPMWRLHAMEIELYGSHGMQAWRYPEMLAMIASGRLQADQLVTRTVSLSEGAALITRMADFPTTGFVVIDDFTT
jgi:alcohol dehydrogenase